MSEPRTIGRYRIFDEIASGGMGTVHFGRMTGAAGFARTVAIKRLHPQYAKSPEFVEGLIDEARVAARIHHPNVVATLDVVAEDGEMLLVMEYVDGVTLSHLMRELSRIEHRMPPNIALGVMTGSLYGLHAAHEAKSEEGAPLDVVHRDISPQNIIVGVDGVPRVVDFGVAKAAGRLQTTSDGRIKGKIAYMPPEQLRSKPVDRRADVYSAGVVLWELLAGRRLFKGDTEGETIGAVLEHNIVPVGMLRGDVPAALDEVLLKALAQDSANRTSTAREFAVALENVLQPASSREIADWLASVAKPTLDQRRALVSTIESSGKMAGPPSSSSNISATASSSKKEAMPTVSSVEYSVGFTANAPVKSRRGLVIGGAIALVALGGIGGALAVSSRTSVATHAPPATSSAAPAASTPPPAAEVVSLPVVAVSSPPPAASSVAAPAPPKPTITVAKPKPPDCNPPYTIDANGSRHWKKGC